MTRIFQGSGSRSNSATARPEYSESKRAGLGDGQTVMYEARCEGVGPDQADSLNLIFVRWRKIENDLFKKRKNSFDLSKVADIYDCVVYVWPAAMFEHK